MGRRGYTTQGRRTLSATRAVPSAPQARPVSPTVEAHVEHLLAPGEPCSRVDAPVDVQDFFVAGATVDDRHLAGVVEGRRRSVAAGGRERKLFAVHRPVAADSPVD